ncbi:MAG: SUMF1/EgtB/PvdO family nonheme iron enzyme [bacterium]
MKRLVFFVAMSCAFTVCKKQPVEPERIPSSLKIESSARSIYSGLSLQLSARLVFSDGLIRDVTEEVVWSIHPGKAGRISNSGLLTAKHDSTGQETVTATFGGSLKDSIQIEITKRAISLTIWPRSTTVQSGKTLPFEAIAQFQDASQAYVTDKVIWSTSPLSIARIDSNGIFHALQNVSGEATVIADYQTLRDQSVVQIRETPVDAIEWVEIPAGSFIMGDDNGRFDEKPAHEVFLNTYEIGKYEVTNREYADYLNQALAVDEIIAESGIVRGKKPPFTGIIYFRYTGSLEFPDIFIEYAQTEPGVFAFRVRPGFERYPVVRLNWYGAMAFCAFYGYRLPTEAEWEKAARGGSQSEYGTENGHISHDLANYGGTGGKDIFEGLAPVGAFAPNPYGLYDMSGNAGEFVFDLYDPNYYSISPSQDPKGPGPAKPVGELPGGVALWRGGAWTSPAAFCKTTTRGTLRDQADHNLLSEAIVGFRVAR